MQIFGGLGGVFLLEELMSGATGAMTGFAFPEILVADRAGSSGAGEIDEAADVFYRAVPLMRFEFQEGIGMAIRKEVLQRRGALASAATRAPAGGLDAPTHAGARSRADVGDLTKGAGMDLGLKGKVAMVGGASRGLGYAVAEALAKRGRAVSMASSDDSVDPRGRRNDLGRTASLRSRRPWTSGRPSRSTEWARQTIERFGGIDLLFTNAGGPPAGAPLSFDDAAWQSAIDLLLFSTLRMVRAAVPSMQARGGGAILVSTSSSVKEPIPNLGLSTVLRASVSALAKTLALELAADKIRVNQIIPGRIDTDRVRQLDEIAGKKQGITRRRRQDEGARGRSRWAATASRPSSAASRRSCSRTPPRT